MLKSVPFIITIIIIFSLQMSFFSSFSSFIDGSPLDKRQIALLEKKVQSMQTEAKAIELKYAESVELSRAGARSVASVGRVDMSEFHFSRFREFQKLNKVDLAVDELDKVREVSTNLEFMAQAEFEKTQIVCSKKVEAECLHQIDILVSQFPEAKWTGRGLLILSDYYFKQNRQDEGASLLKIVKQEFQRFVDVSEEAKKLEKRYL